MTTRKMGETPAVEPNLCGDRGKRDGCMGSETLDTRNMTQGLWSFCKSIPLRRDLVSSQIARKGRLN